MKKKVLHVGLDVDDKSFHIGAFCKETGETFELSTRPHAGNLMKKFENFSDKNFELKICYEATYIGYSLCRELNKNGYSTQIIAPSLIPELASNRVKTDRLDARKLAQYYANDLLTPVHVPSEEDEHERDLLRSRSFLVDQRKVLKRHILSACRRNNLNYMSETGGKNHWTPTHERWLIDKINKLNGAIKINLEILYRQYEKLSEGIDEFVKEIEKLADKEKYKNKKDALNCFRGIDTLTAMTLITEIGDINRFKHPKQLTSYCGLDIAEYSSGGKERKFGITKMGNYRIRTSLVESCQRLDRANTLSKRLKNHRKGKDIKIIDIADRCTKRLKIKSNRMLDIGKPRNKVKVACAREFLGFIWEALNVAA
ncbi:MAG: IS110 family transposase [Bacteriovoracaceae bacterium]|nr:IS110 family transposase [Bacteriovoracaceae bacterium]